jgi:hypothetical protein
MLSCTTLNLFSFLQLRMAVLGTEFKRHGLDTIVCRHKFVYHMPRDVLLNVFIVDSQFNVRHSINFQHS